MKNKMIYLIALLVLILIPSRVFAVEVTEENLKSAFDGMIDYEITQDGKTENVNIIDSYTMDTTNKKLTVVVEGETYTLNYTLGDNPTFTYSKELTSTMTYDDYKEDNSAAAWLIPYLAVAKVQGANYEDTMAYSMAILLASLTNFQNASFAVIPDDESYTVDTDIPTVKESEFGAFYVNHIKELYASETTLFQDNEDDMIDSMKLTAYTSNSTADSTTLNYKVVFDTTKDYSKLNGLFSTLDSTLSELEDELENSMNNTNNTGTTLKQVKAGQEVPVPDTAMNYPRLIIILGLFIILIGSTVFIKSLKKAN